MYYGLDIVSGYEIIDLKCFVLDEINGENYVENLGRCMVCDVVIIKNFMLFLGFFIW